MTASFYIIILQIIAGLLSAYLIYYAQQKGKNQADKQDLKKLTEIVEDVKQKYVQENELLKSSLAILANKENILFTEGKNAIIEFYSNLNKWLWHNLNISAHEYNQTNFTELSSRILTMRDHYNDTNISYGKIQILLNDDALIQAGHEAVMETLYLHQFVENTLKGLQTNLSTDKNLLDTLYSKEIKFDTLSQDMKSFYQSRANENAKEKKQMLDTFMNERSGLFSKAMNKRNVFRDIAKNYLTR
jgi:hypothetical protein